MSFAAPATNTQSLSLLTATLAKSVPLASEGRLLTFQVMGTSQLEFLAGQYVRIEAKLNGNVVSLVYSIASPPGQDNRFELCLKPGKKGSSGDYLCALREGEEIRFSRPQGVFVLHQPAENQVFLAAGTGIAPIRSMVHWLMSKPEHHRGSQVWLLYGARDPESLFFHAEFLHLAQQHSTFHYTPILSRPQKEWNGASGYVQHHLHDIAPNSAHAYLCGPPAMIHSASHSLHELGWPENVIHYERNEF
jgi:ferredoxin-NADP reductase